MSAHAVVIGIDKYARSDWNLTGAVRDAIAFARWAVGFGGVDPANLTLHLSPRDDDAPIAELLAEKNGSPSLLPRYREATARRIETTLDAYDTLHAGQGADRFWFYYAGHGLASDGPSAGPVIVPADEDDIRLYLRRPIGLETFRERMQDENPKEQFYFVDACRDVIPSSDNKILTQKLVWKLDETNKDDLSTQAILLSTTVGSKAKEIRGRGVFGRLLLAGLQGIGPDLQRPAAALGVPKMRVSFSGLVDFITEMIRRELEAEGFTAADTQVPHSQINRGTGDVTVTELAVGAIPKVKLTPIVRPDKAKASGKIEFLYWNDDEQKFLASATNPPPLGPPIVDPAEFSVPGGKRTIRVTANGYQETVKELLVVESKRFFIDLKPLSPFEANIPKSILEKDPATVLARSDDWLARITIIDSTGKEHRSNGNSLQAVVPPGYQRVRAELTTSERVEKTVYVAPGGFETIDLMPSAHAPAPLVAGALQNLGMAYDPQSGRFDPAEVLGPIGGARLGSLLAYAAWAARWSEDGFFAKLHQIDVDRFPDLAPESSALQVLIGDALGDQELLNNCSVEIDGRPRAVRSLGQLSLAREATDIRAPGACRVRVEIPGFAATTFPLTLLPRFITVLIISRESDSDVDVQQHLNPIDPRHAFVPGHDPPNPGDVRLIEISWRALEAKDPLDAGQYEALLFGKRSSPLLAVIAGYRMFRTEHGPRFHYGPGGQPSPRPPLGHVSDSPLWNLVSFAPALPDVHVLAGLYDAENRDEHFERALAAGTPILVDGFWKIMNWLRARAKHVAAPPPWLREFVLPGTAWTAFSAARQAAALEGTRIVHPSGRTLGDSSIDSRVVDAGHSVGRIDVDGRPVATCVLLSERFGICPVYVARDFANRKSDGTWVLDTQREVAAVLGDVQGKIVRLLATVRAPEDSAPAGDLEDAWPVIFELGAPLDNMSFPAIAASPTEVGRKIAVVGFPMSTAHIPGVSFQQFFVGAEGQKHIMLGTVRASNGWTIDHDSYTAAGTGGSCVIDVETGNAVGIHVYSRPDGERRIGTAIALAPFAGNLDLVHAGARFNH